MCPRAKAARFLLRCASLALIIAGGSQKPVLAQITSVSQVPS